MPLAYIYDGKKWQCNRWEWLVDCMGVTPEQMPELHEMVSINPIPWTVFYRFFGIASVPPTPEYSGVRWSMKEIREEYKLNQLQGQQEILAIKTLWLKKHPEAVIEDDQFHLSKYECTRQWFRNNPTSKPLPEKSGPEIIFYQPPPSNKKPPKPVDLTAADLPDDDATLLARHRFPMKMFTLDGRTETENRAEMKWFVAKVRDFEKVLADARSETLCRQLLLKDLMLERLRQEIVLVPVGEKRYSQLEESIAASEEQYERQWKALNDACPMAAQLAQKAQVQATLAALIQAIREYQSDAKNALVDGIFTALEIKVLCRQSEQLKAPKYRYGWTIAKNLAKIGWWDKDWRPQPDAYMGPDGKMKGTNRRAYNGHSYFAALDKRVQEAINQLRIEKGIPLVDLMDDTTANGEYPELTDDDFKEEVQDAGKPQPEEEANSGEVRQESKPEASNPSLQPQANPGTTVSPPAGENGGEAGEEDSERDPDV